MVVGVGYVGGDFSQNQPTPLTIISSPYQLNKQVEQSGEFISASECELCFCILDAFVQIR